MTPAHPLRRYRTWILLLCAVALVLALRYGHQSKRTEVAAMAVGRLPMTRKDFFQPGTQPNTLLQPLASPWVCRMCHEFDEDANEADVVAPVDNWQLSMMGQATRDPIWRAALAIANQDVANAGELCIRCHAPFAWLNDHSVPPDTSAFFDSDDWEGVACIVCHRMVDPVYNPDNPAQDSPVSKDLAAQGLLPHELGNGRYVIDPFDSRRGPLNNIPQNMHGVPIVVSPFHDPNEGRFCGTCHDLSNPGLMRQSDGTWALNAFDAPHPTHNQHDMMPLQRTYSEWLNSDYARTGVMFTDKRYGGQGSTGLMRSCQNCHMPRRVGGVCTFWVYPPFFIRDDVADHSFAGANTWVVGAAREEFGQNMTAISPELEAIKAARTRAMLRNASDMHLVQLGDRLKVRIVNYSGHKLPTGFPEGRRVWLNVRFLDAAHNLIAERGAYNCDTAELSAADTKVYEIRLGMDDAIARRSGRDVGMSFHLALNNTIVKDNRIPPMGFSNASFAAVRALPVAVNYADGQYWDDTVLVIPSGAVQAMVTSYYQTTSKEYIEFLRDANTSNSAGQNAYELWTSHGKSAPVEMDMMSIALGGTRPGDLNNAGVVNVNDLLLVIQGWGPCPPPGLCTADGNGDGQINVDDLLLVVTNWG